MRLGYLDVLLVSIRTTLDGCGMFLQKLDTADMNITSTMDNGKENPSRSRAQQLFNKNVELEKRRNAAHGRAHLDPNAWQTMRENYEAIVLEDPDYALKHDVEYALWQLHYRRIDELRILLNAAASSSGSGVPPNGKSAVQSGPERVAKIRSQFKSFLSEATGFYHDLMVKIRAKYGLPMGYLSIDSDNQIPSSRNGIQSNKVKKGLISCHRCLIYLGDLARYKCLYGEANSKARDFSAASSYYMQACSIWPSSGNPHHQLALLAGYCNDELLTIYRYFRSLAVEIPFETARDNLILAFDKNRQTYNQLFSEAKNVKEKIPSTKVEGKARNRGETRTPIKANKVETVAVAVTGEESNHLEKLKRFTTRFIRLNGVLFTRISLEFFAELLLAVKNDFLVLLSSGPSEELNFGSDAAECGLVIVRMSAILIFTVENVSKDNDNKSYADILQRSVLLQSAMTATFELMGCIIDRFNQLKDPSESFLLPGIGVFIEWLACNQHLVAGHEVEGKQSSASLFWPRCASFFNKLLSTACISDKSREDESCFTNMSKYDESETSNRLALPEDFELRGFIPLLPAQRILDFSRKHVFVSDSSHKENISRIERIVAAGKSLASAMYSSKERLYFDSRQNKFVFGIEPEFFDDGSVMNHLEQDIRSDLLAISTGAKKDISTAPKSNLVAEEEEEEVILFKPFTAERNTVENGKSNFTIDNRPSVFNDSFLLQSTISATTTSSPFINGMPDSASQYLLPVEPSVPSWSLGISSIASDLGDLKMENRPLKMPELLHASQSATVSFPGSQFLNAPTSRDTLTQALQTHPPFEAVLTPLGVPGLKKNPISRPVKHVGPPPGFSAVTPKFVDDSLYGNAPRSENSVNPVLDDYRWLDGYQLSSSSNGVGFSNSMNHMGATFSSVDRVEPAFASANQLGPPIPAVKQLGPISSSLSQMNDSVPADTLSFPGKKVLPPQFDIQNQPLPNHRISDYTKHYEKIAQQFINDQKVADSFQQYQDNSAWGGRFFV